MRTNQRMRPAAGRASAAAVAVLLVSIVLCSLLLSSCSQNNPINEGETYLNGSWYHDDGDLHVGYNFFPNGTGFLFIGSTPVPMRYGLYMGNLYLDTDGDVSVLPFGTDGDALLIGNLRFLPVESPEGSVVPADSSAQTSDTASQSGNSGFPTVVLIIAGIVCAILIAVILVRYFSRRGKSR